MTNSMHISGTVQGDGHGQVAIGHQIHQQHLGDRSEDLIACAQEARQLFTGLRALLPVHASAAQADDALARLAALEEAVLGTPDPSRIDRIRAWFAEQMPEFASSVLKVLVSPAVIRLVEVGGGTVGDEVRRRIG